MKKDRKDFVGNQSSQVPSKRQGRREFLIKTGGILAAGAFGAVPMRGWAADPVNIGALYPTTGSMAQIGVGCVAAAKLAVEMVNDAGGIKSLGGAKLNLIISDVQSDTTVTRTETDRLITGNKLSAIHGCFASALTLIASEVAERAKVPLITGSSSDQLNKNRTYTFTPFERQQVADWTRSHVIGAPETMREGLDALVARTGVDELMVTTMVHSHAERVESYRRLAATYSLVAVDQR